MAKRIEIDFFEPLASQDPDSWTVPVVRKETDPADATVREPEAVGEELWLMAGRSRYCPADDLSMRVHPAAA